MMKPILNSSITIIIIDEVSILPSNYLELLDERLKLIYDSLLESEYGESNKTLIIQSLSLIESFLSHFFVFESFNQKIDF